MATNRLDVILSADTRQIVSAFREVGSAAEAGLGAIRSNGASAQVALEAIAGAASRFGKSVLEADSADQKFNRQLTAMTHSAEEAAAILQQAGDFADEFGIDDDSVKKAEVTLTRFKLNAQELIPTIAGLADILDQDVAQAAESAGLAFEGNERGLKLLMRTGVVTEEQLKKNGAVFDENGKLALEGAENLKKYQDALQASIGESTSGILEARADSLTGAMARLRNAIDDFKKQFAAGLEPPVKALAGAVTTLVKAFGDLPDWLKTLVAGSVTAAVGLAGLVLAIQTVAAAFAPLVGVIAAATGAIAAAGAAALVTAVELNTAEAAAVGLTQGLGKTGAAAALMSAQMGVALGLIALVTVATIALTKAKEDEAKASQALLDIELKRTDGLRKHHEMLGKSADELRKQGATAKDISDMIQGYQDAAEQARARGDKAGAERASAEIRRLKEIQSQFATTEADKRAEAKATEAAQAAAAKRAEEFKKDRSAGVFDSKSAELAALDSILQGLSKQSEVYRELSRERIRLAREVGKEEQAEAEKGRKKELDAAKRHAELLGAQGNKQGQIDALRALLESHRATAEEEGQIEIELARLEKQLSDEVTAKRKQANELHKKQIEAKAEAAQAVLKAEKDGADADVKALEDRLARGEDVLEQLKAEIDKRAVLEKKIQDGETAKGKRANPAQSGQLDKAAAAEKEALDKRTSAEKEKLDRSAAERRAKDASEETSLAEREAKLREDAQRRVYEAGGKNHAQLVSAMKERQRLEESALAAKLQADSAGKAGAELERLQRTYNADLLELRQRNTDELRKANQELDKAKQTTKSMTGAVLTLDEFVKQSNEEYAGGPEKAADEPDPKALKAALEAKDKIQMSLGTPGLPPPPKPGQPGYRQPSALTKQEPASQEAGSSLSAGGGDGPAVSVLREILAAIKGGGKTGPMATESSLWSSTPNRCF